MINGLEGIPGSGKSYEAVVFHVLVALKSGRKVITNLPLNVDLFAAIDPTFRDLIDVRFRSSSVLGRWDATNVDDKGNGSAFLVDLAGEVVKPSGDNPVFGQVWDYYDTWRHADGRGALFVIDECHVCYPAIGTPASVVEWFKLHRHFNVDVLLMTQSFRDMNQPMARLIAMLIKVRKADILGRAGSYIRKVHSGYRGAVISTDERKYEKQYFPLYKSHTQGNSVGESGASDVKPFIVKFNRFKNLFLLVTAAYVVYAFYPYFFSPATPKPVFKESIDAQLKYNAAHPNSQTGVPLPPVFPSSSPVPPAPVSQSVPGTQTGFVEPNPDPLFDKKVHITGWIRMGVKSMYTFAVSGNNQREFEVKDSDLVAAGYKWRVLADCMGYLTFKTMTRTVTCDPPALSVGSNSRPIVISDGQRESNAVLRSGS